jgi:hypothetical protein
MRTGSHSEWMRGIFPKFQLKQTHPLEQFERFERFNAFVYLKSYSFRSFKTISSCVNHCYGSFSIASKLSTRFAFDTS